MFTYPHGSNYSPGIISRYAACFHFTLVFVRAVFVLLVVEIDTDDLEGVTDAISSGKRIRPAKRRRALTTCRLPGDSSPDRCL